MEQITEILYWISTGLLVPVIVLILLFFVKSLILIGTFYSTYIQKIKSNKKLKDQFEDLDKDNVRSRISDLPDNPKLLSLIYIKKLSTTKQTKTHYEKMLSNFEIECIKDLAESQTLAKLGPILGLMGTLIPMGPALVGLASGDIASMATNMQVAFATTVIGLLIGAVGFVVLQIKKRWIAADINNFEFIVELLSQEKVSE